MIPVLIFLALCVAGVMLLLLLFQDKLMYFPSAYTERELDMAREVGLERIEYTTAEGRQVAFYLPPPPGNASSPGQALPPEQLWFVYCGNGSRVLDLLGLFLNIPDDGSGPATGSRGVLLLDYPGYGACEGAPSPESTLESGRTALRTLWETRGWAGDPVAGGPGIPAFHYLGHSLGCAGTLQLAADLGRAESVVLMSPFTSMRDMANARVTPAFSWLLRHNFDNRASLAKVLNSSPQTRVTLIHGVRDSAIPVGMSRQLAEGRGGVVTLIELPEADHNDFVYDELPLIQGLILGKPAAAQ